MKCISRITDETYAQFFGNRRNKFYVEFRCGRPCISNMEVCAKCFEKNASCKLQASRKFNHGRVSDPIPDCSHIYGGTWYEHGTKKWGAPSVEIIEYALQCQKEARGDYIVVQPVFKAVDACSNQMPKEISKNAVTSGGDTVSPLPKKRGRKPKVASNTSEHVVDSSVTAQPAETKKVRKPRVASTASNDTSNSKKKKPAVSSYGSLIAETNHLVHKEVVLPTHIETTMEEFDSDGYRIEYVRLVPFDVDGTTYFRDSNKNKLYRKMKDKIGAYIGRWNPETNTIISDVADSDDESCCLDY